MKTLSKQESVKIMKEHLHKEENLAGKYFDDDGDCCIVARLLKEVCDNETLMKIQIDHNGSIVEDLMWLVPFEDLTGISADDLGAIQIYNDRNDFNNVEWYFERILQKVK